jgi:hypothetical protein
LYGILELETHLQTLELPRMTGHLSNAVGVENPRCCPEWPLSIAKEKQERGPNCFLTKGGRRVFARPLKLGGVQESRF